MSEVNHNNKQCDETFKKLIFVTKEYKKMRDELERISHITIQQHEQMKQQQFTIENMQLYIAKQQDELIQLKQQLQMEKELCEDAIHMNRHRRDSPGDDDRQLISDTSNNNNDNDMEKVSRVQIEQLLKEKHDMYHLLLRGDDMLKQEEQLREMNLEDQVSILKKENADLRSQFTHLQSAHFNLQQIHKNMEKMQNSSRTDQI